MTGEERTEWLAQRKMLVIYLEATQQQIIDYPAKLNDEDYYFLIRKAIYYQEIISKIDNFLDDNS